MKKYHMTACEILASIIRNQPNLLQGFPPSKEAGVLVAGFCAGFIEKFAYSLEEFDKDAVEGENDDWSFLDIKAER